METPEILDCGHAPSTEHSYNGKHAWQFVVDGERKICHASADARVLECGHTPTPHGPPTTGYGTDAKGNSSCYACAAAHERASMIETGRAVLYVVQPMFGEDAGQTMVSDWPGGLKIRATGHKCSPRGGGFGADRMDVWFTGPDGKPWH